jgi:UDPglucose 6-dehydrogenase
LLLEGAVAFCRFFERFLNEGPAFAFESQGRHVRQAKSLDDECSDSRRSVRLRVAGRCLVGGELIRRGVAADQARQNSKQEGPERMWRDPAKALPQSGPCLRSGDIRMRVAVIGAGYVGLVSGVCLADFGHHVTCIDKDGRRIAALKRGEIPIFEPGLDGLVEANVRHGRLSFAADTAAVAEADAVLIAVGTPSRRGDGHADLSFVYDAVKDVAPLLAETAILVTKSTVPVGTGDEIERIVRRQRPDADIAVVSNPEFLREGTAIKDFNHPDRVVIGTDDARARAVLADLYRPLLDAAPFVYVGRRTAELIKYAANAFLATKISFINEIADLCECVGGDVEDVAHGIGLDERIGPKFLHAGPGIGGSCLPKDGLALIETAHDNGMELRLIETVCALNEARKRAMAHKVAAALGGSVRDRTIGVLGLTFKADTDDTRDSPSIPLIMGLLDLGATVRAYDPAGMEQAKLSLPDIAYCSNAYAAATGADALVIATEWQQFRMLDLALLKRTMAQPLIVDLRNIYDIEHMRRADFRYVALGRSARATNPAEIRRKDTVAA